MANVFLYIPAGNPHTDPPTGDVFEAGQIHAFDDQVTAELDQANRVIAAGAGFDVSQLVSAAAAGVDWGDITNRPTDLSDPALVEAVALAGLAHKRLDGNDGLFGEVTIANASSGDWFTASGDTAVITLPRTLERDDYLVSLEVVSASPSAALAGQPRVIARSSNAFTIQTAGSARDVVVRWQVRNS